MKEKTIQQIFISFLKKNDVLKTYKKEWDKDFCEKPIKDRLCYISDAFAWVHANYPLNDPFVFWEDLNKEWKIELKIKTPCDYNTRCHECGRFVTVDRYTLKTHGHLPVCQKCAWDMS